MSNTGPVMAKALRVIMADDFVEAPKWTTTAPTEPGWYWVRHVNRHNGRGEKFGVAQYDRYQKRLKVSLWSVGILGPEKFKDFRKITHWLGPLPVPEPPNTNP